MSDLKPCPFCGGKAILEDYGLNENFEIVKCTECGARTKLFLKGLILGEDAREAWNRRAKDEASTITPERKPGRWIRKKELVPLPWDCSPLLNDGYDAATHSVWQEYYRCSNCDWKSGEFKGGNFCPNCGADMRGEAK